MINRAAARLTRTVARWSPRRQRSTLTIIGLYYLTFFAPNSLVGWVGGFYQTMPTTTFWLLHAGFALGSGLCFVLFKFIVGHHLEANAR